MSRRPLGLGKATIALAAAATLVPPWLLLDPRGARAKAFERRFHRWIARGFGLEPQISGTPGGPGTLLVANHISWADIVSIAAILDTDFVAKADVARYPALGRLADRTGTIFVDRDRRTQAGTQMARIRERLDAGRRVLMFPEGTTSDGSRLLPFRSSLFAAADTARGVQPVTLSYTGHGGSGISAATLSEIAWVGDQGMLPNAAALARIKAGISIHFHDPVDPAAFTTRKALADYCRDVIATHYAARLTLIA